ncbi:right-handed parallel beta-helix repeat-containing protein [Lysobacter yangpyeongensis]|uniref:Right-handed parallel beta-helix repeat-containing protein n=1 Tax=Lysobacter yangpyeongensis TaxID=346182 RepID=A0ABW0SJ61_9GAMM
MRSREEGRRRCLRASLALLVLAPLRWPALASAVREGVDVRALGARGDGIGDDTAAFQRAIDRAARGTGLVEVPAGRYLIDPQRSLRLRNGIDLRLAPDAVLMAKPNAAPRAYVLLVEGVSDVTISGGAIVGERDAHLGKTGEWGHGIMIRGASRVSVRDMTISRCWGDGISVGGLAKVGAEGRPSTDILIANVRCRGNRRQGLTIGRSRRVRVRDSEFSDTHGTKPEYGIDIEPDKPGTADDITIERCIVKGNRGGGIQAYHRASRVTIRNCTIEGNGFGIFTVSANGGVVSGNTIRGNRRAGVALRGKTRGFRVEDNRFARNNTTLRLSRAATRSSRGHVQLAKDALGNSVAANQYE